MNHLILWSDIRLFVGSNNRPVVVHKHPVIQFVLSTDGRFKTKSTETGEWVYKQGLLIMPNYYHECDATDIPIISLDIEPDSRLGNWILFKVIENKQVLEYPSNRLKTIDFELLQRFLQNQSWAELYIYFKEVFKLPDHAQTRQKDQRISSVIEFIHDNIHETLNTEQLMEVSFLSESRLLHLFKEQMGLPVRNYILWYRLKVAIEKVIQGLSLTQTAHLAGFSDQSHFTRSCISMIGLPPSSITKNSKFIQVSFLS